MAELNHTPINPLTVTVNALAEGVKRRRAMQLEQQRLAQDRQVQQFDMMAKARDIENESERIKQNAQLDREKIKWQRDRDIESMKLADQREARQQEALSMRKEEVKGKQDTSRLHTQRLPRIAEQAEKVAQIKSKRDWLNRQRDSIAADLVKAKGFSDTPAEEIAALQGALRETEKQLVAEDSSYNRESYLLTKPELLDMGSSSTTSQRPFPSSQDTPAWQPEYEKPEYNALARQMGITGLLDQLQDARVQAELARYGINVEVKRPVPESTQIKEQPAPIPQEPSQAAQEAPGQAIYPEPPRITPDQFELTREETGGLRRQSESKPTIPSPQEIQVEEQREAEQKVAEHELATNRLPLSNEQRVKNASSLPEVQAEAAAQFSPQERIEGSERDPAETVKSIASLRVAEEDAHIERNLKRNWFVDRYERLKESGQRSNIRSVQNINKLRVEYNKRADILLNRSDFSDEEKYRQFADLQYRYEAIFNPASTIHWQRDYGKYMPDDPHGRTIANLYDTKTMLDSFEAWSKWSNEWAQGKKTKSPRDFGPDLMTASMLNPFSDPTSRLKVLTPNDINWDKEELLKGVQYLRQFYTEWSDPAKVATLPPDLRQWMAKDFYNGTWNKPNEKLTGIESILSAYEPKAFGYLSGAKPGTTPGSTVRGSRVENVTIRGMNEFLSGASVGFSELFGSNTLREVAGPSRGLGTISGLAGQILGELTALYTMGGMMRGLKLPGGKVIGGGRYAKQTAKWGTPWAQRALQGRIFGSISGIRTINEGIANGKIDVMDVGTAWLLGTGLGRWLNPTALGEMVGAPWRQFAGQLIREGLQAGGKGAAIEGLNQVYRKIVKGEPFDWKSIGVAGLSMTIWHIFGARRAILDQAKFFKSAVRSLSGRIAFDAARQTDAWKSLPYGEQLLRRRQQLRLEKSMAKLFTREGLERTARDMQQMMDTLNPQQQQFIRAIYDDAARIGKLSMQNEIETPKQIEHVSGGIEPIVEKKMPTPGKVKQNMTSEDNLSVLRLKLAHAVRMRKGPGIVGKEARTLDKEIVRLKEALGIRTLPVQPIAKQTPKLVEPVVAKTGKPELQLSRKTTAIDVGTEKIAKDYAAQIQGAIRDLGIVGRSGRLKQDVIGQYAAETPDAVKQIEAIKAKYTVLRSKMRNRIQSFDVPNADKKVLERRSMTRIDKAEQQAIQRIGKAKAEVILSDIGDVQAATHELAHGIDARFLVKGRTEPLTIKERLNSNESEKSLLSELEATSRILRRDFWEKGSKQDRIYVSKPSELMADYGSLYLLNPELARQTAPKVSQAYEAIIGKNKELNGVIETLLARRLPLEGPVSPRSEAVLQYARIGEVKPTTVNELLTEAKLSTKALQKSILQTTLGHGRIVRAEEARISREAEGFRNRYKPERLEEWTCLIEKINHPRTGKTLKEMESKLTEAERRDLNQARYMTELNRQKLNKSMEDLTDDEWITYREDYVYHMWRGKWPTSPVAWLKGRTGLRTWARKSPSQKQRKLPTYADAPPGLEPVTLNWADLYEMNGHLNFRIAENARLVGVLRDMIGPEGEQVILKPSEAKATHSTIDRVRMDYPAIRRVSGHKDSKTDAWIGWEGSVLVDMRAAPYLRGMFEHPFRAGWISAYQSVNSFMRNWIMSFSTFHHINVLGYSAWASLSTLKKPLRGSLLIGKEAKLFGRSPIRTTLSVAKQMVKQYPEITEEAIRDGVMVKVGAAYDSNVIDRTLNRLHDITYGIGPKSRMILTPARAVLTGLRKVNQFWQRGLWGNISNLKVITYYLLRADALRGYAARCERLGKAPDQKEMRSIVEAIAQHTNHEMGGMETQKYPLYRDPRIQQLLGMTLLAPDWTFAQIFVSAEGPLRPWRLFSKDVGVRVQARLGMRRTASFIVHILALANAINLLTVGKSTFLNERGHRIDVDLTPLLRKWRKFASGVPVLKNMIDYDPEDKTRYYVGFGKALNEVLQWGQNPAVSIESKMAPALRAISQQVFQKSLTGFDNSWARSGLDTWDKSRARVGQFFDNFIPFSFKENSVFLSFSASKGMTPWKAMRSYEWIYLAQAKQAAGEFGFRGLRSQQSIVNNMEKLIADVDAAAIANGTEVDRAKSSAMAEVRRRFYAEFWQAIEEGNDEKALRKLKALNVLGVETDRLMKQHELTSEEKTKIRGLSTEAGMPFKRRPKKRVRPTRD